MEINKQETVKTLKQIFREIFFEVSNTNKTLENNRIEGFDNINLLIYIASMVLTFALVYTVQLEI